jgi:hypothetical protein
VLLYNLLHKDEKDCPSILDNFMNRVKGISKKRNNRCSALPAVPLKIAWLARSFHTCGKTLYPMTLRDESREVVRHHCAQLRRHAIAILSSRPRSRLLEIEEERQQFAKPKKVLPIAGIQNKSAAQEPQRKIPKPRFHFSWIIFPQICVRISHRREHYKHSKITPGPGR